MSGLLGMATGRGGGSHSPSPIPDVISQWISFKSSRQY
ncbi:hypothetical protein CsSME_00016449 [Camellia sinensis var. sinensis]